MKVPLILFCYLLSASNVYFAGADESSAAKNKENPFTPKASLMRYWNSQITTKLPISPFLLSKASPLSSVNSAFFANLAAQNTLSAHLPAFCSSAKLLCFPDSSPSLEKHDEDSNFAIYLNKNFTNYGTGQPDGTALFKNYSQGDNFATDTFRRYSRNAGGHKDKFSHYAPGANVAVDNFNTYGNGATGGAGDFKKYNGGVNFLNLRFNSYADDGQKRAHKFTSYATDANVGVEWFRNYGKNGNADPNEFVEYELKANLVESNFTSYGKNENRGDDTFKSYGLHGDSTRSSFQSYGDGGNGGSESFSSYKEHTTATYDKFKSYGKNANSEKINFARYFALSAFDGDNFTGYGQGAKDTTVGFNIYGDGFNVDTGKGLRIFKDYAKQGITFAKYNVSTEATTMARDNLAVKKWVEPGKFFRESMLKEGNVMPMPDIKDKMPERPFLPRSITSKLPFSTAKIAQSKEIFHAADGSAMRSIILDAINECERAPSPGETKRCVGSAEDLIDFATSVLGRNAVVWTTQNVNGAKKDIEIGRVKRINGGRVTKSVSCHQSLYPYLVYYCHSVPKVRVFEADILDPKSKLKINDGVAICHLDTSSWSPSHCAFLALGSGPGQIEVCHWIFENDMTWTTADD